MWWFRFSDADESPTDTFDFSTPLKADSPPRTGDDAVTTPYDDRGPNATLSALFGDDDDDDDDDDGADGDGDVLDDPNTAGHKGLEVEGGGAETQQPTAGENRGPLLTEDHPKETVPNRQIEETTEQEKKELLNKEEHEHEHEQEHEHEHEHEQEHEQEQQEEEKETEEKHQEEEEDTKSKSGDKGRISSNLCAPDNTETATSETWSFDGHEARINTCDNDDDKLEPSRRFSKTDQSIRRGIGHKVVAYRSYASSLEECHPSHGHATGKSPHQARNSRPTFPCVHMRVCVDVYAECECECECVSVCVCVCVCMYV